MPRPAGGRPGSHRATTPFAAQWRPVPDTVGSSRAVARSNQAHRHRNAGPIPARISASRLTGQIARRQLTGRWRSSIPGNTSENLGTTPKARRAAQAVRERTSPRLRVEDRTFKRGRFRPALGGGGAVAMGQTGKYNDTSPARIQVPDGDP